MNTYNYEDVELSLECKNYKSHPDPIYRCSDHLPVSQEFQIGVFGKELAIKKQIDAYGPVIKFHKFHGPWFLNEEAKFSYEVHTNGGRFLNSYDWIGIFRSNFTSLTEYPGYVWASSCRRTDLAKTVIVPDTLVNLPGKYVLVYISKKDSILGMSDVFQIT